MKCDNCGNEMDCYKISKIDGALAWNAPILERRFRCMECGIEKVVTNEEPPEDEPQKKAKK